ncbi:MAG: hypothetical protein COB36_03305 [Alphaproteobacteria bacterium]|nr:MAG: hypothetical protein COB36_03305 [Alphaproteobacteria bacterium]
MYDKVGKFIALKILLGLIFLIFILPARAENIILEDNFSGVLLTMPDGAEKLYPDPSKWAFTFLPGIKWPDSYGDGTNWLEGNDECQSYITPFIDKINEKSLRLDLRYDPFLIKKDGLHIKADILSAEQQHAYQIGGHRRFGSGMILSRKSFTYGKIRLVAKLPNALGSWPALWLLPKKFSWPPEIDIFEAMAWGKHAQEIHSGYITPNQNSYGDWFDIKVNPSEDFHEYVLDWTPETLTAYFDNKILWQKPTPSSMHNEMYIIINLAVGGKWAFNELDILPIDGRSQERLIKGANLIEEHYPAEMIVKSLSVTR